MTAHNGQILPFFIPHLGCPCRCVFCDQRSISGQKSAPSPAEIEKAIDAVSLPMELAFFGGSFTALPQADQEAYLSLAKKAKQDGRISGIRLSTRPDCLSAEIIERLLYYNVDTVEIGVQSMDDRVLALAKRGHKSADSVRAVNDLKAAGFITGVQLMPGLPGADFGSDFAGAAKILAQKPDYLRIYPTLVLAKTKLCELWRAEKYKALTMAEGIEIAAAVFALAEKNGTATIRIGINPSTELSEQVLDGPYHPAFGHMVKSYFWQKQLLYLLEQNRQRLADFQKFVVHKSDLTAVFGQNADNKKALSAVLATAKLKISGTGKKMGQATIMFQDGYSQSLARQDFVNIYIDNIQNQLTTSC